MPQWKILFGELAANKPIYRQLEMKIIAAIKNGQLKAGQMMPGSRKLADQLHIQRKTVRKVYERLIAKGWLYSLERKGTFVKPTLPLPKISEIRKPLPGVQGNKELLYYDDYPDINLSPLKQMGAAYRSVFLRKRRLNTLKFTGTAVYPPLVESLIPMLHSTRGIEIEREELCLTHGHQTALYLIIHNLPEGRYVAMSGPGHPLFVNAARMAGTKILLIPADRQGMNMEKLAGYCKTYPIELVMISPESHYPTTVALPFERRKRLIRLAGQFGFSILELDLDHEFYYTDSPVMPLFAQFPQAPVIYISSVSKMLPSLFLMGIIAGPAELIRKLNPLENQRNMILDQVVDEMIRDGIIQRFARKARKKYQARRDEMAAVLNQKESLPFSFQKPMQGLTFWLDFQSIPPAKLLEQWEQFGVFFQKSNGFRLGFGTVSPGDFKKTLSGLW